MSRKFRTSIMASVCGLAFAGLAAPAFAQSGTSGSSGASDQTTVGASSSTDSSTSGSSATSDQTTAGASSAATASAGDPAQQATRQAEQVGIKDARAVEGAFVVQGVSPTARPIFLIVGPQGELLAVAAPLATPAPAAEPSASETDQSGASTMSQAPEPVENPYRATQVNPATPAMWDPLAVENAMQSLELGQRGAAGELPAK